MTFALTIVQLEEALDKPGCPICRMTFDKSIRFIDSFLWESVNDPKSRQEINAAGGFCPEHTRMLVSREIVSSGSVLGVNMVYELLSKNAIKELQGAYLSRGRRSVLAGLKRYFKKWMGRSNPAGSQFDCPICTKAERSAINFLGDLFEMVDKGDEKITAAYLRSDGLCQQHLQKGLQNCVDRNPRGAEFLVQDSIRRLEDQRRQMLAYIQKHNWANRDEQLTPEEIAAWQQTLTFFTGLPADQFSHRLETF